MGFDLCFKVTVTITSFLPHIIRYNKIANTWLNDILYSYLIEEEESTPELIHFLQHKIEIQNIKREVLLITRWSRALYSDIIFLCLKRNISMSKSYNRSSYHMIGRGRNFKRKKQTSQGSLREHNPRHSSFLPLWIIYNVGALSQKLLPEHDTHHFVHQLLIN